jgi:DNA-directed RNA polymerase subunit beta
MTLYGRSDLLRNTLDRDSIKTTTSAAGVYRKLRPGEPPTVDSAKSHINSPDF